MSPLELLPLVELFAVENKEVGIRLEDPAAGRDGSGRVDVVAGDHAHCDARSLARLDGVLHFRSKGILNARDAEQREAVLYRRLVRPIRLGCFLQVTCSISMNLETYLIVA